MAGGYIEDGGIIIWPFEGRPNDLKTPNDFLCNVH